MKGLKMNGILSIDELKDLVSKGTIDTVLVCLVDMQGRLMGKRFHQAALHIDKTYKAA